MGKWDRVPLGSVIKIDKNSVLPSYFAQDVYYVGLEDIEKETGRVLSTIKIASDAGLKSNKFEFTDQHILYGKLRPNLNKVALPDFNGVCSTDIYPILPITSRIDRRFLGAVLRSTLFVDYVSNKVNGVNLPRVNEKIVSDFRIPLPPLPIQQKIADALDKASALIEMRKAQIEKLDLLIKSQFIEMFGDPVTNPKGWETIPLAKTGSFKNGINFSSNESGASLYCLGVGDFGNRMTINNTEQLSRVFLDKKPSAEHLLKDEDIVFVRSNGNKELVGRCVAVFPGKHETTFSGFCIRYRKTLDSLLTEYLLQVLKASSTRYKMIGRGANIQNLNQELLSQLIIPVPPITLQQKFVTTTSKIVNMKRQLEELLTASEIIYNSLMQKCFNGEIF